MRWANRKYLCKIPSSYLPIFKDTYIVFSRYYYCQLHTITEVSQHGQLLEYETVLGILRCLSNKQIIKYFPNEIITVSNKLTHKYFEYFCMLWIIINIFIFFFLLKIQIEELIRVFLLFFNPVFWIWNENLFFGM